MRIALVSEHASPLAVLGDVDAGGQNVHVAALAAALAASGDEVRVFTRRTDPFAPRWVAHDGYEVVHVDAGPPRPLLKDALYPLMPQFAGELAREWISRRPDVVHAHFWMSGIAALAAGPVVRVPVVQTFHALGTVKRRHQRGDDTSPPERIREERRIAGTATHIIATCFDEARELEAMGVAGDRVSVVPCGVDTARFRPDGPASSRGPAPRILVVSRLVPRKGIAEVVTALASLPDAELVIAGGPDQSALGADPEAQRLRRLAEELGVGSRVTLLGGVRRDCVPALMRSADVVAGVPWYEPFGIVPVEAMACGVPVVGSAVGGLTDTIVHGVTGLLVPPRDPDALAAALAALLGDPALRRRLGDAGVQRARRYDWRCVAGATKQVYAAAAETGALVEAVGS